MAPHILVGACPNCGAPINPDAIENPATPACPFCHTLLPVAAERQQVVVRPSGFPGVPFPPVRRGRGMAVFWLIFTVVVVVGSVGLPLLLSHTSGGGGSAQSPSYSIDAQPVLGSPADAKKDAFVLAPGSGSDGTTVLRRVDTQHNAIIWSTGPLPVTNGSPDLVAAGSTVMVVADTGVYAFSSTSGKRLWQASVSNDLAVRSGSEGFPGATTDCVYGCAAVVGSTLVTLAKDGTVQALSIADGAQLWSRHLSDTPDFLQPAGAWAAVVSAPTAGQDDLLLFNPLNGGEVKVAPGCAPDGQGDQADADTDAGFFVSPDGTELTAIVDGPGGCIASYALPSGKLLWRTAPDADNTQIPTDLTSETAVSGDGYIAWSNDTGPDRPVFVVDLATHKVRQLIETGKDDQQVNLDGIVDGTLVLEIAPSYASDQPDIYGVSLRTGKQEWEDGSRVTSEADDGLQAVTVTSTGIAIGSCESSADDSTGSCKFEAVDPTTGTVTGTLDITDLNPAPQLAVLAGPAGEVLADVDNSMAIVFDPVSGKADGQWPVFS